MSLPVVINDQDRGLPTARERGVFFQLKGGGIYYRLKSFLFGGAADKENVKVNEHRNDGRNFVDSTVAVAVDVTISGTFMPYYDELPTIMRNFFGQPVASDLIDANYAVSPTGTRRREVFEWPLMGAPLINTWGIQAGGTRYKLGKLLSWNNDVTRNADGGAVSGNAEFHCNFIDSYGNPLPGSVAQNEKYTVTATLATGALGLAYTLPGSTTAQAVSIAIGDTALAIKAKFEANSDGVTVNVVGSVPAPASTSAYVVSGAGNTSYNGTYVQAGTYNGNPYYQLGTGTGSRYLFYHMSPGVGWALGPSVGEPNPVYFTQGAITGSWTVNGGGTGAPNPATATTLTPGGATGSFTVEFASPTNARVVVTKTSGVAGWALAETLAGSDGKGAPFLTNANMVPVESDNVIILMTDTRAQLDAVGLDDENSLAILLGVLGHQFGIGAVWKAVWTENRSQAPSNFTAELPAITFSLTTLVGANSEALHELQNGCVMGKKYFRIHYRCGQWQWLIDCKMTRSGSQDKGDENDLPTRTTPFVAADDTASVFRVTCIGPASDYFVAS